jgi:hypothetical protein
VIDFPYGLRRRQVRANARAKVVLINVLQQRLTSTLVQFWRIRPRKTFAQYIFDCRTPARGQAIQIYWSWN